MGWIISTTYYDERTRPIQLISDIHSVPSADMKSCISFKYDFVGNLLQQRERHDSGTSTPNVLLTTNTYDNRGRLLTQTSTVNGTTSPSATVLYGYDELGKLIAKTYGSGVNAITDSLKYNIQGWLTSQNNTKFEAQLHYYDPTRPLTHASYTGNITQWDWKHKDGATTTANSYAFAYDKLARMTDSRQFEMSGQEWFESNRNAERGLSYDRNGNIKTLLRTTNGAPSDNFTYSYTGNQLTSLANGASTHTYAYDANGNKTNDGLNALKLNYNFLNLVSEVRDQSDNLVASYFYLTDGTKLGVRDGSGQNGLDYVGSLVYSVTNGVRALESVSFSGGRIVASSGSSGTAYTPYYHLTDHLGSVRVIVDGNSGAVVERDDYYAFGGRWQNSTTPTLASNRHKYNGKEDQAFMNVPYSDYGARMYDNRLGRWFGVDPLAEKYYSETPYEYCGNNPIKFIDPNGEDRRLVINSSSQTIRVQANYYTNINSRTSALAATSFWNRRTSDTYTNKDGIIYNIIYELQVMKKSYSKNDPAGNTYRLGIPRAQSDNGNVNGEARDSKYITVLPQRHKSQTGVHEMGHTLGIKHDRFGIMTPASNDPLRSSEVTQQNINNIIEKGKGPISIEQKPSFWERVKSIFR